jgi:hypothetical protein
MLRGPKMAGVRCVWLLFNAHCVVMQRCTRMWAVIKQERFGEGRRFTYKGGYFETRELVKRGLGKWEDCPDMFADSEDGTGIYK